MDKGYVIYILNEEINIQPTDNRDWFFAPKNCVIYYRSGYCAVVINEFIHRIFDYEVANILDVGNYSILDITLEEELKVNVSNLGLTSMTTYIALQEHHRKVLKDKPQVPEKSLNMRVEGEKKEINRNKVALQALELLLPTLPEVSPENIDKATKLAYYTADSMLNTSKLPVGDLKADTANNIAMSRCTTAIEDILNFTDAYLYGEDIEPNPILETFLRELITILLGDKGQELVDNNSLVEILNKLGYKKEPDSYVDRSGNNYVFTIDCLARWKAAPRQLSARAIGPTALKSTM